MTDPTQAGQPTRPGRWCEQHDRRECTARRKGGDRECHSPAIRGLSHCRMHAGVSGAVAKAKGEALEALSAWSAVAAADGAATVEPARAVLGMLHMSWTRVHLLAGMLEQQVDRDGLRAEDSVEDGDGSGAPRSGFAVPGDSGGLIGHTFAADKQAGVFASGEAVRGLAQLEAQERDRCVRFAKAAHDMGIADREIDLAERQARGVALGLAAVLNALAVEASRREEMHRVFTETMRAQLREVDA